MNFIKNWLRTDIQAINAYSVPNADGLIKMDAMESPFELPFDLAQQHLLHLAKAQINRYPLPNAPKLTQTLRTLMHIPEEFGVLLGNGSDELIQLLALACEKDDTILSVEPSFVMYEMIAKFTRLNYVGVDLDEHFNLDLSRIQASIKQHQPKLIFIAYPNNPTGNTFDRHIIEKIVQNTHALVVLDEAYYAYAQDSFLDDISQYSNLVVLRTISKIGFAGLRLGLLIGNQDTIKQLDKLRMPYNINALTQISADFLLKSQDEIDKNSAIILTQRAILMNMLAELGQTQPFPSQANFILFKAKDAQQLFVYLKKHGVLIKNLSNAPKLKNCLRVTVGSETQNQTFIKIVRQFYD
jgi:histidinol-phosphate aminotransferase